LGDNDQVRDAARALQGKFDRLRAELLALPEEQREKRYKAERKSINDAIDEFNDSDLLQRFYSNEVARRREKPNQPRAGQGGLTCRSEFGVDESRHRPQLGQLGFEGLSPHRV
jgi:hypothetical protein